MNLQPGGRKAKLKNGILSILLILAMLGGIFAGIGPGYVKQAEAAANQPLYEEDFTSDGWSASDNVVSFDNIQILHPEDGVDENEGGDILTTTAAGVTGTVVWKFQAEKDAAFKELRLVWQGRAIIGDSSYVKLYVSTDGITYQNDSADQILSTVDYGPNGPTTQRMVNLTQFARGNDTVYIKALLYNSNNLLKWVNINYMKVTSISTNSGNVNDNPRDTAGTQVITYHMAEDYGNISYTGSVSTSVVTAKAGDVSNTYHTRDIAQGGEILVAIPENLGTATNLKLEVREIHQREDSDISYTVSVNGAQLYHRAFNPCSDGANHYFITIPKAALTSAVNAITIKNTGGQEIRISDLWLYQNFEALMTEENTYRPLEVVLFSPSLTYTDYEADLETLNSIASTYSGYGMYTIGVSFDLFYMNYSKDLMEDRIDHLFRLAKDTGLALKLDLNSWWSGTPDGMDGQGGFWKDIKYNQIIYDRDNVNGRGEWQLSTPNIWSDTPWLTMNDQYYNQVRLDKLEYYSSYIAGKEAEYRAEGSTVDVSIFTENEPIYWAYRYYNPSSPEGKADLSYQVIQQAAQDGITLDPTDGYTKEENMWLFQNLTTYISGVGGAIKRGAGNSAVIVDNGAVTYPDVQLTENIYSHMMLDYHLIVNDENRKSWEAHVTDSLRLGVEAAVVDGINGSEISYIIARGKYADVNAERSAMSNFDILPLFYEYGADYVAIFNYAGGDAALITAEDNELENIIVSADIRNQNLWIEYRADVERIIRELRDNGVPEEKLQAVRSNYNDGRYVTAYRLLMELKTTAQLPERFVVKGYGALGSHPVHVETDSQETVGILLEEEDSALQWKASSDSGLMITLSWTTEGSYDLLELGRGEYRLEPAASGAYKAVNGVVTVSINTAEYEAKDYPDRFEAMYYESSVNAIRIQSQEPAIGEYARYVELPLAEGCTVTRGMEGTEDSYQTAALSELTYGDKLELELNAQDEVMGIKATCGHISGTVAAVEYSVVNGSAEAANAFITITAKDGQTGRYEISSIARFDYPTMTGGSIFTSSLADYGLSIGDTVYADYSPYTYRDSDRKLLRLYLPYTEVINEDFEEETWADRAEEYTNIEVTRLDSNYSNKVATPSDKDSIASIVWKVESFDGSALGNLQLQYGARSILNTKLIWYISQDNGDTWRQIKDNGDWGSFSSLQNVYQTGITASTVLIKVEMSSIGTGDPDTWSSLDRVIIKIPSPPAVSPAYISTGAVTGVSVSGAAITGSVTSDGGAEVTERGFVCSTSVNPAIGDAGVTQITAGRAISLTFFVH